MADAAAELEAALTSGGTLLVWAEKYRLADPSVLPGLRHRLLSLGDRARRLARHGALDEDAARELLDAVSAINRDSRRLIDDHKAGPIYRRAVEVRSMGDSVQLSALLPQIFADLRVAPPPPAVYWGPTWQQRGRPLPAEQIAVALRDIEAHGVAASGDDLTPGVDPDLPGVLLSTEMPLGAPLALRYDGALLPLPSLRLGDDQVLVPSDHVRLGFVVALAAVDEPLDEWVADPAAYLDALERACRQQGLSVGQ